MIIKTELTEVKKVFAEAVKKLRDQRIISEDFIGSFTVNCSSGGVTRVDANIPIK